MPKETITTNIIRAPFRTKGAARQKEKFSRVFVHPQDGDVSCLKLERKNEHWMITSPDFPGLFLCSFNLSDVLNQIGPAIEGLWEVMQHPEKYRAKT